MKYLFLYALILCVMRAGVFASSDDRGGDHPNNHPNALTLETHTRIWNKIHLHKINQAYDAIDTTDMLTVPQKEYVKFFARGVLKERVNQAINMKAIDEKIMEFQILQSFANEHHLSGYTFEQTLNQLQTFKNYFARWVDPITTLDQDMTLFTTMYQMCAESNQDLNIAQFLMDSLLFSQGNPYAFLFT